MRIIFGWNHFKIKTIDPFAVGLSQQAQPGYQIEIRQRYFHLFWIPCFSLGKKWALRKDGQLYEMPEPYKFVLQERKDLAAKTPWYTYAGPLLAASICLYFYVNGKVEDYRVDQYEARQFSAAYTDNAAKFSKPSIDDYYVLDPVDGYSEKFAKVTGLDKNNIQLSYITNSVYASTPSDIAALFLKPDTKLETVTVSRNDSAHLICKNYADRLQFDGITLPGEKSKYRVERIVRLDGPIIDEAGFTSFSQEVIKTELKNTGLEGELVAVEKVEGDVQWQPRGAMPIALSSNDRFMLVGSGNYQKPYKARLEFKTGEGKKINYLMSGQGHEQHIQRIN
ncbi:hypothetical protein [Paraflavitalea pollutisoli]|uniref:hypothetical protein n=1 Tax=Paraflavitalea pollutisoli TaxID=3034143 RepID=UPI0023EB287A|nr:hypothetical protein [Paraflavitalea sp. H1-2-19X]